jgi:hypothetical protein
MEYDTPCLCFDIYNDWLNWACGGKNYQNFVVKNDYFIGLRMIRSVKN